MLVNVLLIHEVYYQQYQHEQEQQVRDLENVKCVERPNVQKYHQFEFDGERWPSNLFMQSHLAEFAPAAPRCHNPFSFGVEDPVSEIDEGH